MDDLATLLLGAANQLDRACADALAIHGVTVHEWRLLRELYAGPAAPSAVAGQLGLTRGAITKLVDRLRARRLLVRAAAGRADRRFQSLALTGSGAQLVAELRPFVEAAQEQVFAPLSEADRAKFSAALTMLTQFRDKAR